MSINDARKREVRGFEKYLHEINYPREKIEQEVKKFGDLIFTKTKTIEEVKYASKEYMTDFDKRVLEQGTITATQGPTEELESTIKEEHDDIENYLAELEKLEKIKKKHHI